MVLGRKVSPENDPSFQKIVEIEKRTLDTAQKFIEISNQVQDIENGHLPKIHIDKALKDLEKRSKTCSEAWMKVLTDLDSIQLDESQTLARPKRKSIVDSTNANMDRADEILRRIKNLKDDTSKFAAESISKHDKEDKKGDFFISQAHILNWFNFNAFRNMKLSVWHTVFSFQLVFKF